MESVGDPVDTTRLPGGRRLGLVAFAVLACHEDAALPSFTIETERTRIALDERYELDPPCAGDLAHIDAQVARAEQLLGVERSEPVSIYLGSEGVDEFCATPDELTACYRGDLDWIFGPWSAIDHEIVHAVARDIAFPSRFWSEGTASVLSGRSFKSENFVLTPDGLAANELTNYVTATHLSRFVTETHGWGAFNRIIRGESITEVLGISDLELTQSYEEDAPYSYPPLDPCPYPPLAEVGAGHWEETVALTCDSPEASSFEFPGGSGGWGPVVLRSVELEAGEYEFEYTGVLALDYVLLGCQTDILDAPTELPSNGDLFNEADGAPGTEFPSAGTQILSVTDGTYRVALVVNRFAPPDGTDASATFSVKRLE